MTWLSDCGTYYVNEYPHTDKSKNICVWESERELESGAKILLVALFSSALPAFLEIGFWSFALRVIIVHFVHTSWHTNSDKLHCQGCCVYCRMCTYVRMCVSPCVFLSVCLYVHLSQNPCCLQMVTRNASHTHKHAHLRSQPGVWAWDPEGACCQVTALLDSMVF